MSGIFYDISEEQAKAMIRFRRDPMTGGFLMPLLESVIEKEMQSSLFVEGPELHRMQGKVIALKNLVDAISAAETKLQKSS